MNKILFLIPGICFMFLQCKDHSRSDNRETKDSLHFDPGIFTVKSNGSFQKAKGQVLYLPIYSNIPYSEKAGAYDLSGFLTIHNTDLVQPIRITQVLYFHNEGHLVKDFLVNDTFQLKPLQSKSFFIPEKDKSGTGANFLLEWKSDSLVNIPLAETVMVSLQGIALKLILVNN